MSTATKSKALTTIKEFEEKSLSLLAVEILADQLQTRAKLDMGFVQSYAKAIAAGSIFPPVIVYRLPDGRLVLVDGFHRFEAHKRLGLKAIRAVIREGTFEDALLAGIAENLDPYHSRKVGEEDRYHAVKLLAANETTRDWSDAAIGQRCGVNRQTVRKLRLKFQAEDGIAIPRRVKNMVNGRWSGRYSNYYRLVEGKPSISDVGGGGLRTCLAGKHTSLPRDPEEAAKRLDEILDTRKENAKHLETSGKLTSWLTCRGIVVDPIGHDEFPFGGISVGGTYVVASRPGDSERALACVARCLIALRTVGRFGRAIVCGYPGSNPRVSQVANLAARIGVETLTPEELVAEFGPKSDAAGCES